MASYEASKLGEDEDRLTMKASTAQGTQKWSTVKHTVPIVECGQATHDCKYAYGTRMGNLGLVLLKEETS
jgi:hypothetical protein